MGRAIRINHGTIFRMNHGVLFHGENFTLLQHTEDFAQLNTRIAALSSHLTVGRFTTPMLAQREVVKLTAGTADDNSSRRANDKEEKGDQATRRSFAAPRGRYIGNIPYDDMEFKYDGFRAQIHWKRGRTCTKDSLLIAFSRSGQSLTAKFREVLDRLRPDLVANESLESMIIDAEVVSYDFASGMIEDFSQVAKGKKGSKKCQTGSVAAVVPAPVAPGDVVPPLAKSPLDASTSTSTALGEVPSAPSPTHCVFAFDLLALNDRTLLDEPLSTRRSALAQTLDSINSQRLRLVHHAPYKNDFRNAVDFVRQALQFNCEGIMLKTLAGTYRPGQRTDQWIKLKKDYFEAGLFVDTLDLVPVGAWYGNGTKSGYFSSFLMACRNASTNKFETVCKVGIGFDDDMLENLTVEFRERGAICAVGKPGTPEYMETGGRRDKHLRAGRLNHPDVWVVDPTEVWELRGADLTTGSAHSAGISLRHPRFVRKRSDRTVLTATTTEEIVEMFGGNAGGSRSCDITGWVRGER